MSYERQIDPPQGHPCGKVVYPTRQDASRAGVAAHQRNRRKGSGSVKVYRCQDCQGYHWSTRPR